MDFFKPIKENGKKLSTTVESYDEESRRFRKYLAQQEALRQLEQRKTQALAAALRVSFLR